MTATAGTGFSDHVDAFEAGAEAARAALRQAATDRVDLVLLFGTAKHDPERLRDGVRSAVGAEPLLFGGAAPGVLTNDRLGYGASQVGVGVVASDEIQAEVFVEPAFAGREYEAGRALGEQIADRANGVLPSLFLLHDHVRSHTEEGMRFNLVAPYLRGLGEALGAWPSAAGLGVIGDFAFNPSWLWAGDAVERQAAAVLALSGGARLDTITLHGCRPASSYFTITASDDQVIHELDGRPAADVIGELVGAETPEWEDYPVLIPMGLNRGERFGPYDPERYAIRGTLAVDKERRALVMGGDDLYPGEAVQLMRWSVGFDYIQPAVETLFERAEGHRPVLALYIDCGGRTSVFCGSDGEDAAEVQAAIAGRVPMLGMYAGVEIARTGDAVVQHNATGVLCLLSVPT